MIKQLNPFEQASLNDINRQIEKIRGDKTLDGEEKGRALNKLYAEKVRRFPTKNFVQKD